MTSTDLAAAITELLRDSYQRELGDTDAEVMRDLIQMVIEEKSCEHSYI